MWAEQFDEKFTDVLSLEDAISSRVAEAIVPHLSGDERIRLAKRGTDDPQAHEAYLRGRYLLEHVYRRRVRQSSSLLSPGDRG